MPNTVYLIRHAETAGAGTKRYKGQIDVPLSANGVCQMQRTAFHLRADLKQRLQAQQQSYLREIQMPGSTPVAPLVQPAALLSAIYTSGLQRALRSARIVGEAFGLDPVVIDDLRERSFGAWEGMTFAEIRQQYPREFTAWAADPLTHSPVNGEPTRSVAERAIRVLHEIVSRHAEEQIAIVSHGGVIRVLLCHIMGIPLSNIFRIEQDTAAVNIIEFWDAYPVVRLMNADFHSWPTGSSIGGIP